MQYDLAIFDFDGTLADSLPLFGDAFNEIADRHGFRRVSAAEVPALRQKDPVAIMRHVRMPAWKLPAVTADFMKLMSDNRARVPLFAGVAESLRELASSGLELAVVSSNSRDNVVHVLGPGLASLIYPIECGVSIFGKRARIIRVLRATRVEPRRAIYIGDQTTDFDAARHARVAFGAVSWGYADVSALERRAPETVFRSVKDLQRLART